MTAAQPAWRPVEAVVARRFCAAPRCDNEFRPGSLSDPYCSERCAAASAAATAQSIAGPACARPGCQKEARPGFPHCSRDCAEVAAQARAAAAAGAGPTQLAQVLGLPAPEPDVDDAPEPEPDSVAEDLVDEHPPAPGPTCAYGPCDLAPLRSGGRQGWQSSYCGWAHVVAAKAAREAGNGQAPAEVHTPDPGDEHPGAAGALAGSLLNQGEATGLEASPPRTPDPQPPGGLTISARTVTFPGGGYVAIQIAVDLFELEAVDRLFILALVDRFQAHQRTQGAAT